MQQILTLLGRHGAAVVFVIAFLEQIGAPTPAIPVFIVAGAWSARDASSFLWLLSLIVAGSMIADTIWFFLGRKQGYRILGLLCRISLSPDSCVRKTEDFFERWGFRSLLFAKFVPGFSLIAPPLAGALPGASYARFFFYDVIGALTWGVSSLTVGVVFRGAINPILEGLGELGDWALIVIGGLLALYLSWKWIERHRFIRKLRLARITVDDLRQRMHGGEPPVVLDVRSESAQKREPHRIPGALLVQPEMFDEVLADVATHREIILYCT